jgi:hypothetical protein
MTCGAAGALVMPLRLRAAAHAVTGWVRSGEPGAAGTVRLGTVRPGSPRKALRRKGWPRAGPSGTPMFPSHPGAGSAWRVAKAAQRPERRLSIAPGARTSQTTEEASSGSRPLSRPRISSTISTVASRRHPRPDTALPGISRIDQPSTSPSGNFSLRHQDSAGYAGARRTRLQPPALRGGRGESTLPPDLPQPQR